MQRNLILTKDGSHTIAVPGMNVTYHSIHGAIGESMHVFIRAGFYGSEHNKGFRILEMGLGTGLNALLTLVEAEKIKQPVHYTAIELFPMDESEIQSLNYCSQPDLQSWQAQFKQLHQSAWEEDVQLSKFFTLRKVRVDLLDFSSPQPFELIYYDAFAPGAQPELWTTEVFKKLYGLLDEGGLLVTYCSKGEVRRSMMAAGFRVEKIPGPMGKREMVRAWKEKYKM